MKSIMLLIISIIFLVYGVVAFIYPAIIKNSMNKSHKAGVKDLGASDGKAEKWVKKYVEQRDWHYKIMGIISAIFGGMLLYAVVRTMLKQ